MTALAFVLDVIRQCATLPIMTNQTLSSDIRRYAVAGAQARLAEVSQESEAIRRAFPELREGRNGGRVTGTTVGRYGRGVSLRQTPRPPPRHHVRRSANSCRRADEEILGGEA